MRPCIALLHSYNAQTEENADPEVELIPKLDAREVAAVFTAPFHSFLRLESEDQDPGGWYRGSWSLWHDSNWRSKFSLICSPVAYNGATLSNYKHMEKAWKCGPAVKPSPTHLQTTRV